MVNMQVILAECINSCEYEATPRPTPISYRRFCLSFLFLFLTLSICASVLSCLDPARLRNRGFGSEKMQGFASPVRIQAIK